MEAMESAIQILVIDDEKYIRQLTCRILMDLGYQRILEAENGKDGLQVVASKVDVGLIILDIEMPTLDGLGFLRLLRNGPVDRIQDIPVVMLTGAADFDNLKKAAEYGIHGFLAKPVSKANLEKQIKRALSSDPIDIATLVGGQR